MFSGDIVFGFFMLLYFLSDHGLWIFFIVYDSDVRLELSFVQVKSDSVGILDVIWLFSYWI